MSCFNDHRPSRRLAELREKDPPLRVDTNNAEIIGHKVIWQNSQDKEVKKPTL